MLSKKNPIWIKQNKCRWSHFSLLENETSHFSFVKEKEKVIPFSYREKTYEEKREIWFLISWQGRSVVADIVWLKILSFFVWKY